MGEPVAPYATFGKEGHQIRRDGGCIETRHVAPHFLIAFNGDKAPATKAARATEYECCEMTSTVHSNRAVLTGKESDCRAAAG